MLQNTKELHGARIAALDGDVGHVKDFYFDDKTWVIRYLVADTGTWLSGRLVLLSALAFAEFDRLAETLHFKLHRKQIEASPAIDSQRPVSRQYEVEYYQHYGWPVYWDGGALWGIGGSPVVMTPSRDQMEARLHHRDDKHLRSAKAVIGYAIHTTDGEIGHVSGFMFDEETWAIRAMAVETGHWYAGKKILIPTNRIERISYEESSVFVGLTKADIQQTTENQLAGSGIENT